MRAKPNSTYKYDFQIALYVVLFQSAKNRKKFIELCDLIGYGKIRERKDGILEYVIDRIVDIREFLECVRPFVKLKEKQLELMFKIIDLKGKVENEKDFGALLDLIDSYRELNYSKNRKKRVLTP
ncbi:hypothetical protein M1295_01750 [Patescibacteria group bacterium]|nr:hypothetical protein [Patescibacteria group bacterium]